MFPVTATGPCSLRAWGRCSPPPQERSFNDLLEQLLGLAPIRYHAQNGCLWEGSSSPYFRYLCSEAILGAVGRQEFGPLVKKFQLSEGVWGRGQVGQLGCVSPTRPNQLLWNQNSNHEETGLEFQTFPSPHL